MPVVLVLGTAPRKSDTIMTNGPERVLNSLLYEVLQSTTMLLFLLSSIRTSRQKQYLQQGMARPLELPGLPELCISPCIINVPDDDLYGPSGAAAQMAYTGWIVEMFGLWENRYRNELQNSLGENAIRPQMDAFGDLRHIRNDLLHNGTASMEHSGKCSVLKWFPPGERIVLATRHVLDFLNQTGVLSLRLTHDGHSRSCIFDVHLDRDRLLRWTPQPKLVSVRTHDDGRDADPPYKGVTVVFDNGLFANVPFQLDARHSWAALGKAGIHSDGHLTFDDGTVIACGEIYTSVVVGRDQPKPGNDDPRRPITGPSIRFRR